LGARLFESVTPTPAVGRGGKGLCFLIIGTPGEGIPQGRGGSAGGAMGNSWLEQEKGWGCQSYRGFHGASLSCEQVPASPPTLPYPTPAPSDGCKLVTPYAPALDRGQHNARHQQNHALQDTHAEQGGEAMPLAAADILPQAPCLCRHHSCDKHQLVMHQRDMQPQHFGVVIPHTVQPWQGICPHRAACPTAQNTVCLRNTPACPMHLHRLQQCCYRFLCQQHWLTACRL